MHLKRLEIHGFKSFADRLEIEFQTGITAVVGPNGSGKSNVSDALLWVLGEQNARSLRGEGAADLIFAGTDRRRPLGMAEVSLSIDNADRGLPVEFGEVTITRRVYRSGEGEYFINRTACRLRDIYELFLDTGVGRDAYSIIGQNQIHAVLSARGEERRELLEEAAGIKKYRHRRRETHRKLETTRANLTRVADILGELESQVEPLHAQAAAASSWRELDRRLRDLEIGLLALDLLRKTDELAAARQERLGLLDSIEGIAARHARDEAAEHAARGELSRLDGALESIRRSRDLAREEALRLEGKLGLARQQGVADAAERLRLVAEQARSEARAEEIDRESHALAGAASEWEDGWAEWTRKAAEQSPEQAVREREVRDGVAALDRIRRSSSDAAAHRAACAAKRAQAADRIREDSIRLDEERRRVASLAVEMDAASTRDAVAHAAVETARTEVGRIEAELAGAGDRLNHARTEHDAAHAILRDRQAAAMRLSARLRSLEEMHRSLEGVYRGVKTVLQAARGGRLEGEYRVVADLLSVPQRYAVAIEVALGAHVQDIVTPHDRHAQAAIRLLKAENGGRATFLPLDLVRGDRMDGTTGPGVHGVAADLVDFPCDVRPAVDMLLGRVWVVEDMETAVARVRRARGSSAGGWNAGRMVTLEGEMIHPNGSLTGGSREGGPGILSRKLEIDRLRGESAGETARLEGEQAAVDAAARGLADCEAERDAVRGDLAAARVSLAQAAAAADAAAREARRIERDRNDASRRVETLDRQLEAIRAGLAAAEDALRRAEADSARLEAEERETGARLDESRGALDVSRASRSEVELQLARAREQRVGLDERGRRIERARREAAEQRSSLAESLGRLDERLDLSAGEEAVLAAAVEERRAATAALEDRLGGVAADRTKLLEAMSERAEALKALVRERDGLRDRAHRLEVREAALASDLEHLELRLRADYDAEPDHAPMLARAVASRQNTAVEVNRLKRDMALLGTVNLGAIDEYRRVRERVEFLSAQRADLEEAEATLLGIIAEIDATTQEAFHATFVRVARAFDAMFRRLFDGGRTELILTDPENVLETGIDIIVQPPGKKLQHLQLLSGGEKALTAVALLFALLEVKPSPFCLLDEVDAALDEANVGRFAEMLRDFARRSQFIVITHNKATMAAADTLCGVTMEEPGISKILSVRLED